MENVYTISIFNEHSIQNQFRASGKIADDLFRRFGRPRLFRGSFKMKTEDGAALVVDLSRTISIEAKLFAELSDSPEESTANTPSNSRLRT